MGPLDGKTAVITGAGRKALAQLWLSDTWLSEGANVVVTDVLDTNA